MRFGSVCSGIEAASVAWHPIGWEAAWLAEVDIAASAVLAHRLGATAPIYALPGSEKAIKKIAWGDRLTNWGDFTKLPDLVRSGEAEAPDVLCGGTPCFTAGQMVLTSEGHKPIEDVVVGDMVATHRGRFRPVLRTGAKTARVGEMKAVGQSAGITCTPDHPFYVAADLSRSTRVAGKPVWNKMFGPMEWRAASDSVGMFWSGLSDFKGDGAIRRIPQPHGLSRAETMRLLGWYLGDGWVRCRDGARKKDLYFGIPDVKVAAFREAFPKLNQAATENGATKRIAIGCTDLCEWIIRHLGSGAAQKTIPGWLLSDPDRHELLAGYIATDGCVHANDAVVMNSVSERLSRGVAALAQTLGYAATVTKVSVPATTVIEGRTVNQQSYFTCSLFPEGRSRKSHREHGLILRKVQSFKLGDIETVFNIEVSEDNSFVLNGAIVHNCQSYSIAGRREGLDDARGQLTLKFVELADAIDERRAARGEQPCTIFWENVPGVLSSKDNAFGCFLADLAGEDVPLIPAGKKWTNAGVVLGPKRAVAWVVRDAQYFGLAQRRARVFVVASAREGFDPAAVLFEFDGVRRDSAPSREAREDVAGTLAARTDGGGFPGTDEACSGYVQPVGPRSTGVIAMVHGQGGAEISEDRCPTLTYNHEAPIAAYGVALRGREGGGTAELGDEVAGTLRASGGGGDKPHVLAFSCKDYGNDVTADLAPTMRAMNHSGSHADAGGQLAVCVTGDITHTLRAEGFDASEDGTGRGQPIVPAFGIQTAVTPKFNEEISFTLTTPSPSGGGQPAACMDNYMAVRRLVPVECEALQGFHPNWTLVPTTKVSKKRQSDARLDTKGNFVEIDGEMWNVAADGPRYKQLGNSWAVPCVRWIGERIAAHLLELDAQQTLPANAFEAWLVAA